MMSKDWTPEICIEYLRDTLSRITRELQEMSDALEHRGVAFEGHEHRKVRRYLERLSAWCAHFEPDVRARRESGALAAPWEVVRALESTLSACDNCGRKN
jgi:hypothetical protein